MTIAELKIGIIALLVLFLVLAVYAFRRRGKSASQPNIVGRSVQTATSAPVKSGRRPLVVDTSLDPAVPTGPGSIQPVAAPHVPFELEADGYADAVKAWLERLFEALLDQRMTMEEYETLLTSEVASARQRLELLDAQLAEQNDAGLEPPFRAETIEAIEAIDWCRDWAKEQGGIVPDRP